MNQNQSTRKRGNGRRKKRVPKTRQALATARGFETRGMQLTHRGFSQRIRHTEFLRTLAGSVAYSYAQYPLNPGIVRTFPWLGTQAQKWEQYHVHSFRVHYRPRCAATTSGSVMMAIDYDPADEPPTSEAQIMTYYGAQENAAWKEISISADPSAIHGLGPRKFTRSISTSGDSRTFDFGRLYLATVGMAGATDVGKIFVEYDIELFVPQTETPSAVGQKAFFTDTGDRKSVV